MKNQKYFEKQLNKNLARVFNSNWEKRFPHLTEDELTFKITYRWLKKAQVNEHKLADRLQFEKDSDGYTKVIGHYLSVDTTKLVQE
jgi:hypothetical protein